MLAPATRRESGAEIRLRSESLEGYSLDPANVDREPPLGGESVQHIQPGLSHSGVIAKGPEYQHGEKPPSREGRQI